MEYADEPRLVFSPLSEKEYCQFYNLEMDTFSDDAGFYIPRLRPDDAVLELGCGNGRLSRLLAPWCKDITAIDISGEMIRRAELEPKENISYQRMDMTDFSFACRFDAIIIPYNTLNLLGDQSTVERCLRLCREHLADSGKLLLHLYHPDKKVLEADGGRFFQFAIFELKDGDKIIKETLKHYLRPSETLVLEERYRVRPRLMNTEKRDLRHTFSLYAPESDKWKTLLHNAGFSASECCGSYGCAPFYAADSTLLIEAFAA